MNAMYVWFWKSFGKFDFMLNWRSVNSINFKWYSWIMSSLKMAFAWIPTRFIPLLIGFKVSFTKINFEIHDKKIVAIMDAFEEWNHLLEGARNKISLCIQTIRTCSIS